MADEILWINHAGYEMRTSGLRIVHDPWIEGLAFDDGWSLVSQSIYGPSDFVGVNYIWFSHEHPDHFSPAVLRKIPQSVRRTITVLFQKTRDHRVINLCKNLGFKTKELEPGERTSLGNGVAITCGVCGSRISYLFTETPENTYFNANDCVGLDWAPVAAGFSRPVGVLLTQFSYANWAGNPGNVAMMESQAAKKIKEMEDQISVFKPNILIPFASYVWFCRNENFHLNAGANKIDAIVNIFRSKVEVIVLYPGDKYIVGSSHDNSSAINHYITDFRKHDKPLQINYESTSISKLQELSGVQQNKLEEINWMSLLLPLKWLGYIKPVDIFLSDLKIGIRYTMFGGIIKQDLKRDQCEIEFASSSFANILRNGYGYSTLAINGRFLEMSPGASLRLSKHFAVSLQNEEGYTVPRDFLSPRICPR